MKTSFVKPNKNSYTSDPNETGIKKTKLKYAFTPEMEMEIAKCAVDPVYFIENYVKIIGVNGVETLFKMFPYQKEMIRSYHKGDDTISLLGRQMGKTQTAAAYLLWYACFNKTKTILIVANTASAAQETIFRVQMMYESLPNFLKPAPTVYNKTNVTFDNGTRLVSRATSRNSSRGLTINLLYVDEMAFVPKNIQKEFWASLRPTLSSSKGRAIITSTPMSDSDVFADLYRGAQQQYNSQGMVIAGGLGSNGFRSIKYTWESRTDRDADFERIERAQMGDDYFEREHNLRFGFQDGTLISSQTLSRLIPYNPIFATHTDFGPVRWYCDPEPNATYVIGLDPSLGGEGDYSVIEVFMLPEMVQVAEWRDNKTLPEDSVKVLFSIIKYIYDTLIDDIEQIDEPEIYWSFERNSIGDTIRKTIKEIDLDSIPAQLISDRKKMGEGRYAIIPGLYTSKSSKITACVKLKQLTETNRFTMYSHVLINELKNFMRVSSSVDSSYAAKKGEHDDSVMATLICLRQVDWLLDQGHEAVDALRMEIDYDEIDVQPMPIVL